MLYTFINQQYLRNNNKCKKGVLLVFYPYLEVLLCIKYMWGLPRVKSDKLQCTWEFLTDNKQIECTAKIRPQHKKHYTM